MYRQIIDPTKSYTFSDYGKLTCEVIDLVEYFGYKLNKEIINFPEPSITLPPEFWKEIETLKSRFVKRLSKFYFSAEIARREVYVAPILLTLADWIDFTARLEYAIAVSEQLKGTLDYMLLSNSNTVVIIEAKKDDLEKGFISWEYFLRITLLLADLREDTKLEILENCLRLVVFIAIFTMLVLLIDVLNGRKTKKLLIIFNSKIVYQPSKKSGLSLLIFTLRLDKLL